MANAKGRTRRELLFGLGERLLRERNEAGLPPERRGTRSVHPPESRLVIPEGSDAAVMALLGPIRDGAFIAECYLESVTVGDQRIDYFLVGRQGRVQVTLLAHEPPVATAFARTRSFQLLLDGDAPPATQRVVGEAVAREIAERDEGQLWRPAASSSRR